MKQDNEIKKRVELALMGLFIFLAIISLIWLIIIICGKAVGVDLTQAVCYANDERIVLNVKSTKPLENNEYEITTDEGKIWIVNERHCQLVKE